MFCRHHASSRSTSRKRQHHNTNVPLLAVTSRCPASFGPGWGLQGRCIAACVHARNANSSSYSVRTAVAAANTHELTCESSSNSTVQDLLLVRVVNGQRRRNRQQQQHQQCMEQQRPQQPLQRHMELLEEQLQTQPSFVQSAQARVLQQQRQQERSEQEQMQHAGLQYVSDAVQQQQQQQELQLLLQQQKEQWQRHHGTLCSHQQIGLVEPLCTASTAGQKQQQHAEQMAGFVQQPQHISADNGHSSTSGAAGHATAAPSLPADVKVGAFMTGTRRNHRRQLGVYNTHGWNRQEVLQGWRFNAADNVARTPLGFALVRTSRGSQPHALAKQLLHWLQHEQHAVLSAAGAGRTLTALEAVAELRQQANELQQQLQVMPQVRSSRRPEGGRCLVYTLHCHLLPADGLIKSDAAAGQSFERQQPQHVSATGEEGSGLQQQARDRQSHAWRRRASSGDLAVQQATLQQVPAMAGMQPDGKQQQWRQDGQPQQRRPQPQHALERGVQQMMHAVSSQHHNGHSPPAVTAVVAANSLHTVQLPTQQLEAFERDCQQQQQRRQHLNVACRTSQQRLQAQAQQQQQQPQPVHSHSLQQERQQTRIDLAVLQQHQQQDLHRPQQQQELAQSSAGFVAAPAAAGVSELEARGSIQGLADQLEQALLGSAAACVPIAYDKQAAKLLEAAAVLQSRWQPALQPRQGSHSISSSRRLGPSMSARHVRNNSKSERGCGLEVLLYTCHGWVQRQSGLRAGLHVYVFAVPSVH